MSSAKCREQGKEFLRLENERKKNVIINFILVEEI